ncbi:MAG TPA: ATP-dependent DNA helicase RecG [Kofleriaceae bacterium]|nr:ATP-dependent DNA helicase RecG [Kofleriaceae bacterium]
MAASLPVSSLPGIGPKAGERLAERGIVTVEDLLWLLPRRYDDPRTAIDIDDAVPGAERVTVRGRIARARHLRRGRLRWLEVRLCGARSPEAPVTVRFFGAYPNMVARYPIGGEVVLAGRIGVRGGVREMGNPDVLAVLRTGVKATTVFETVPRYPSIPGIGIATLRKACRAAAERASGGLASAVPDAIAGRLGLSPLGEAFLGIHAPPAGLSREDLDDLAAGVSPWHRRLALEDLFVLALVVASRKRQRAGDSAHPCPLSNTEAENLAGVPDPAGEAENLATASGARAEARNLAAMAGAFLPFALTGAQRRVIAEVSRDLVADTPMSRLIQGDVGSGKTAVAFAAALQAAAAGCQVAIMAPTEILAEQHAATLIPWFERAGFQASLVTGSMARGVRASTEALLGAGQVKVAIGTHALLSDRVGFSRLGLVIVDEQHRFGVAQRALLRGKDGSGRMPHLLVMTATPIPRTLALTAYGDLEVSLLDELPGHRQPAPARVMAGRAGRRAAYAELFARIARGERGFVVCPRLVDDEDEDDTAGGRPPPASAESMAAALTKKLGPEKVALAHGQMPGPDRAAALARFRHGDAQVLVATTVIEVGVDVPAATVMLIENADRFGLAQLHQLRGRIGRGGQPDAVCLLCVGDGATADGQARTAALAATTDGFVIAENDLALRGPGEVLGARQAGLPAVRFGDLAQHAELLTLARAEADSLLAADPDLADPAHTGARAALEARAHAPTIYGPESG